MEDKICDILIIGGSYAGLSAAMTLGRALRRVLIVDGGQPCNRQTPYSHNFITQDGSTPAEIANKAREQVLKYPGVNLLNDLVVKVTGTNNNFEARTSGGLIIKAKKLLFTTGIRDIFPDISGFAECWGISVIHCPYCHGYEYHGQRTGILMHGEPAFEFAKMIRNWTEKLTIFTNGKSDITDVQLALLQGKGVGVDDRTFREIAHSKGKVSKILFENGEEEMVDALYARLPFVQHTDLPENLGCELTEMGHIKTDDWKRTTIPGIYAAGDSTTPMRSVSNAVGTGTTAGAYINLDMVADDWATI